MFLIQGVIRGWNIAAVWYLCIVDEVIVCAHDEGGGEEKSSHHQLVPVIKTLHNAVGMCVGEEQGKGGREQLHYRKKDHDRTKRSTVLTSCA